jgi:hypothetical protein
MGAKRTLVKEEDRSKIFCVLNPEDGCLAKIARACLCDALPPFVYEAFVREHLEHLARERRHGA